MVAIETIKAKAIELYNKNDMETIKATALDLYNSPESRPAKIHEYLLAAGMDCLLAKVVDESKAEKLLTEISTLSTLEGLAQKKAMISDMAAPYLEKAACPDGRKQLLEETKEFAAPYVSPYVEKGSEKLTAVKEMAAPYLSSVKESSAPYVAKLEELRRSERVEAMVEAFKEAREHPAEKVTELKSKAVDLIKYENLRSYRDHVMSDEFQADTARLVKVELPAVVAAAAQRGKESLQSKASSLAEEIETHKEKVVALISKGYEKVSQVELDEIKAQLAASATKVLKELQLEVSLGVEQVKADGFSLQDVIERLKRLGAAVVVEGKVLLKKDETMCAGGCADGCASESGDDKFEDASETAAIPNGHA